MDEKKWFEMVSTYSEDAMRILEMSTKVLEYNINLANNITGFKRTDSNFERSFTMSKLIKSISCYRETVNETKCQCGELHCCLI